MMEVASFEFLETLGVGMSGVVYRARDAKGREVAVKLLKESASQDPERLRRFRREVGIAASLEHEHLVAAYEHGRTAGGRVFLSSELVAGCNGAQLLQHNRPLPESAALAAARDLCLALAYLAEQGLVHRDIKPENALVRDDGVVKLSDFGLARSAEPGGARLTTTGQVLGTPYYLAPEQIQARKDIDIRADLYAVGCLLFEWLAGKRPFTGGSTMEIIAGHIQQPPPDLDALRPGLHPDTTRLVAALLTKDREARPEDPAAVARGIDATLAALGAGDGRAALREAVARVPRKASATDANAPTLTSADAVAAQHQALPRLKLQLTGPSGALTLFVVAGDCMRLGRDAVDRSANDVCLRVRGPAGPPMSRRIGREHLRLEVDDEGATASDLGTTGGTVVDGARLTERTPRRLRASSLVQVARALTLRAEVLPPMPGEGPRPGGILITRPQNGPEQGYLLLDTEARVRAVDGRPAIGGASGSILAFHDGALLLDGVPLEPGRKLQADGLEIAAAEIDPDDMK